MNKKKNPGAAIKLYRASHWCYEHHLRICAKILYYINYIIFSCAIPPEVKMEGGVIVAHSLGIVLHQWCEIGEGTIICQFAQLIHSKVKVGKNCLLGAGCVIYGPCTIGDNVKIGANTFVNFDVPDNSTVVGVKGTIISHENKEDE